MDRRKFRQGDEMNRTVTLGEEDGFLCALFVEGTTVALKVWYGTTLQEPHGARTIGDQVADWVLNGAPPQRTGGN